MERAGTLPKSLIDISPWSSLFEQEGPVLSLVIATPAATEQASQKNVTRWEDERRRLEEQGLPSAVADAVREVIREAHQHGEGLALYANPAGILQVIHSPVPPRSELARWETLPSISPLIDWQQHQPPYLVITVDHEGADLIASGWGISDTTKEAGTAHRYPVSTELDERVEEVSATRAADGEGDEAAAEVARMVATAAAMGTVATLEEFRLHLGRGDRAVEGEAPTFAALREGRVAALLLHDDPSDTRRAWFGADPGAIALHRADLEGVGSGPVGEGRMIDVALRAAATTSAAARVVPRSGGAFRDIGALLRWAD